MVTTLCGVGVEEVLLAEKIENHIRSPVAYHMQVVTELLEVIAMQIRVYSLVWEGEAGGHTHSMSWVGKVPCRPYAEQDQY